jgi:MoaA/NifB/PqqE/SkfB family radical SAM enzyme
LKALISKIVKAFADLLQETIKGQWNTLIVDITSGCNLRCPFCYNDFSKHKTTVLMKKETFSKIVEIMPLVRHKIYLSCNFEPTLHPEFAEFVHMIPAESRKKCFFTTNLSAKISDKTIDELGRSGLHYINISLDSFDPAVFESLRKGAHHHNFMNNLDRLCHAFAQMPDAPSLRYITMVFKQNVKEIPSILEKCHEKYLASENEFRNSPDMPLNKWPAEHAISDSDWKDLREELEKKTYKFSILRYDSSKTKLFHKWVSKLQSVITIDAEGAVRISNSNSRYQMEKMQYPLRFFKKARRKFRI